MSWSNDAPRQTAGFLEAGYNVSTCCLKTHGFGGVFSMSLKLSVGLTPKPIRSSMHASPAQAQAQAQASGAAGMWVAPERASHRANPVASTSDAVERGHALFRRDCEQCHGKAGHGDGMQGASLTPRPADLSSERVQSQSDGAIFWKLSEGRGMMPRASLSGDEKWAVIDYIRTLAARK